MTEHACQHAHTHTQTHTHALTCNIPYVWASGKSRLNSHLPGRPMVWIHGKEYRKAQGLIWQRQGKQTYAENNIKSRLKKTKVIRTESYRSLIKWDSPGTQHHVTQAREKTERLAAKRSIRTRRSVWRLCPSFVLEKTILRFGEIQQHIQDWLLTTAKPGL